METCIYNIMSKLLKCFSAKDWLFIFLSLALLGAQVYCNLTLPEYMGAIVGNIKAGAMAGDLSLYWSDILKNGGIMLAFVAAIYTTTILVSYLSSFAITDAMAKARQQVFGKVNAFSMTEINKFSIPSLITRSTNDITQLQQTLFMIINLGLTAPITGIVAVIKILNLSGNLSIVTALSVVTLILLVLVMFIFVIPKFKKIQSLTDKVNLLTRENLTGIKVVRAYGAEKNQEQKFENVNREVAKTDIFVDRIAGLVSPSMSFIMSATSLALVWLGAYLISDGKIDFEILTVFTQYSMQIIMAFMMISMLLVMVPRGIVSAQRINEVLKSQSSITDGAGVDENLLTEKGTIEFKNVSFKYPGADDYVLKNISFKAQKGQTVAFIGSTGSGKSTLINLVPRFYDASEGEVMVDGRDVKEYKTADLHDKIGYIPQKGVLFSGTIEDNIKYGKADATEDEVNEALKISQSKFVFAKPEGVQYNIAQGGHNVSGGQKQRLSIARALVRKPEFLIFDDSFSALDYKTDKALRRALKSHTKGTTCLIVAQRIGTIRDADQIIVLSDGEMVGIGKHDELLSSCPVYKEIALSQLKKEEL